MWYSNRGLCPSHLPRFWDVETWWGMFPYIPHVGKLGEMQGGCFPFVWDAPLFCSVALKVNLKEHKNIKTLKQMRIFISAIVFQIFMFIFFKNFGRGCFSIPTSPLPGNLVKHWLCLYTSMIVCFGLAY